MSRDPELKRQTILEHARKLFLIQGIDHTSVAQIAKETGIAKGLIYYYFQNKEEILDAVIKGLSAERIAHMNQRRAAEVEDFFHQILTFVSNYYEFHPIIAEKVAVTFDKALVIQFHRQFVSDASDIMKNLITTGQREGYFCYAYPEEMLVMVLEGIYGVSQLYPLQQDELLTLVEQGLHLPRQSLVAIGTEELKKLEEEGGV